MASSSEGMNPCADDDPQEDTEDGYVLIDHLSLHKETDGWQLNCDGKLLQLPEQLMKCSNLELDTTQRFLTTDDDVYQFSINAGAVVFENLDDVTTNNQGRDTCDERKEETHMAEPDHRVLSHDQGTTPKPGQVELSPKEQHNPIQSEDQSTPSIPFSSHTEQNPITPDAAQTNVDLLDGSIKNITTQPNTPLLHRSSEGNTDILHVNSQTGCTTVVTLSKTSEEELSGRSEECFQDTEDSPKGDVNDTINLDPKPSTDKEPLSGSLTLAVSTETSDKDEEQDSDNIHDGSAGTKPLQNDQSCSSAFQQKDNLKANSPRKKPTPAPRNLNIAAAKQAEKLIPEKDKIRTRSDSNQEAVQATDQSQASHPAPETGESFSSLPPKLPPRITAAKQAEKLIPEKDKIRTRSDSNQEAVQATDQSQASHPAPETGESFSSLPPKLPPRITGSSKKDKPIVCGADMRQTDDTVPSQPKVPPIFKEPPKTDKPNDLGADTRQTDDDTKGLLQPDAGKIPQRTNQDVGFIPGSDHKQTQSDPTLVTAPITDPSQASSPIVPATELDNEGKPWTGLPQETQLKSMGQVKTYELHIEVKFQRTNGKEFKTDVSYTCNHNQYMKWHYVLGNPSLFEKRRQQLTRKNIPDICMEMMEKEHWLVINNGTVGQKLTEAEHHQLRDKVIDEMLLEMDVFEINSFPTTGIDKKQAAELMMEKSAKEIGHELWLHADEDSDYIHYIYPKIRGKDVEKIIKTVTGMMKVGERRFELDLVFSKVFEKFKVREEVNKSVTLAIDYSESENTCKVILKGKETDLEIAAGLIKTKYVERFCVNSFSFIDIKSRDRRHNVVQIVKDVLCQSDSEDMFWHVNDTCEKISVCCKSNSQNDKISSALKKCLKRKTFLPEHQQLISDREELQSGVAVMEIQKNGIEVIGTEKALMSIEKQVSKLTKNQEEDEYVKLDVRKDSNQAAAINKQEQMEKQNNDNTEKSKGAIAKELTQTIPVIVDELHIFEMLHVSDELQNFAKQNHVKIEAKKGTKFAFLLTGFPSSCVKVKEKIFQLTIEFKQKSLATKAKASKMDKHDWNLKDGHRITVQSSINCSYDVDVTIQVATVKPEKARFKSPCYLQLPQWNEGLQQEKVKTVQAVKGLLNYCSDECFYRIKIDLQEIDKKLVKSFVLGLFERLSGEHERREPLRLIVCTDVDEIYSQINKSCLSCLERDFTDTSQTKEQLYQSPSGVAGASSSGTSEDDTPQTGINIEIIVGQINGTKADAIVNTTGTDLNLDNGHVSKALLKSAGHAMQQEVKRKRPNGIRCWEIVETFPYNLVGCSFVLHGALEPYTEKTIKRLLEFVLNCLAKAEELKCRSIAFPALGTGNRSYPKQEVAQTMFEAVRKFQDRRRCLKEVKFVLYQLDTKTIKAFKTAEKLHVKHVENRIRMEQESSYIGQIGTHIQYGKLEDIPTTGMIYIWEKKSSYNVRIKDHHLLQKADKDVQQIWTLHRDDPNSRGSPLVTSGGNLPVSCIIHVFCEDDKYSMRNALYEGLQKASYADSVTVFFDYRCCFLRFGVAVVDAFVQCVNDVQKNETQLRNILMVIEEKKLSEKFLEHFHKNPNVLREPQPTHRSSPLLKLIEPDYQSIGDRGEGVTVDLDKQKAAWNKEERLEGKTDNYVLIKSIPQDYTEDDIKAEVGKLCAVEFDLMFLPGSTEAMLKCKKKGDTKILTANSYGKICITKIPKQSLIQCSMEMEIDVKNNAREALENMDIDFSTQNGNTIIKAPTKYQLEWAFFKLTNQQEKRRKENSACFNEIMQCTEDVWDIVSTKKKEHIRNLEDEGQKVEYTNGTVTYSGVNATSDDSNIMVLTSYMKELQDMEIDNISIKETNVYTINGWCEEIENNRNKECCVYVKGRNAVFAFSKLYDDVQAIKHQVSVKDGQIKVTGRRGRNLKDAGIEETSQKAMEEESGRNRLESYESGGNDTFQKRNETNRPRDRDVQGHNPEFDLKRQAKNLQEYTTDENIKVYVYEANILKLPVDCIVNAANDTLQHGGGVARVIAQAAGRRLDQEGFDYIRKHGLVSVGKACVTTAGKLHYNCVIHAVGPRWSDYCPHSFQDVCTCEEHLYSALMESFIAAEERGLKSIALPAISAAIFAVPEEVCVYHYAKATIDYSRKQSPNALEEIHFIDINASIVRKIQKMFTTMLKDHKDPYYSTEKYVKKQRANNSKTFQSPDRNRHTSPTRDPVRHRQSPGGKPIENTADADATFSPVYYKDGEIHVLQTALCNLMIKSGDIMQFKADAIVSIEDTKGSGKGKIAKLISNKMSYHNRSSLVSDRKWKFHTNTKPGDVYCTIGYDSGFRYILHAVVPYDIRHSTAADRKGIIKLTLTNILKQLPERMIYAVVMCLIGTGMENKDDVQIAADAFIQVYKEYCKKPKGYSSKPLQITLVCRTNDILDTVMKSFQHFGLVDSSVDTPPAVPPRPIQNLTPEPKDVKHQSDDPGSENKASLENCVICMEKITDRKELKCGHAFDRECIDNYFRVKKVCPTCGAVYGIITGDQPEGSIDVKTESWNHCAGYDECGRISITYSFLPGKQGKDHPKPGKWYKGMSRIAYLPDNVEGREVLEMLKIAFKRDVTFTIGSSRTTGEEGVITWNDIHHKTDPKPNTQFGYPDPTYLDRVKDELSAKGITPKDIQWK